MITGIFTILAIFVLQSVLGMLWYGKYMFGKIFLKYSKYDFSEKNTQYTPKLIMIKMFTSTFLKSVAVYLAALTAYLTNQDLLITFALLTSFIIVAFDLDNNIYGTKVIQMYLLNSAHTMVAVILSFVVFGLIN